MKKFLFVLLLPLFSFANGIDDNCPTLTYKSAPIINADQFICHQQYAVSYSYKTKTPIYTTEYLAKEHLGNEPRTNDFRPDPEVPIEHSATLADYKGTTNQCDNHHCDRGHMTASQDFSACAVCVSESFYFTNMVPQNYRNNEIIWKYMETRIRGYVSKVNPVYVITGTVYTKPYHVIGKGVAVPDSLFKIIIDSETGKSISFMMENKDFPVGSLNGKVVSIQDIEKVTGITFDESLEKTKTYSYQEWFSGK